MVHEMIDGTYRQTNLPNESPEYLAKREEVRLADLAHASGLDGVICSPLEIAALRKQCGPDFVLMVPGIRPVGSAADDQKRAMTPRQAVDLGATNLVVGRPIYQAADPRAAAEAIARDAGVNDL